MVSLITKITFAAVNRVGGGKVCGHIILRSKLDSKKFGRIEGPSGGWYVHNFCFEDIAFFDREMISYIQESCRQGS
jgi:hypothetical protein